MMLSRIYVKKRIWKTMSISNWILFNKRYWKPIVCLSHSLNSLCNPKQIYLRFITSPERFQRCSPNPKILHSRLKNLLSKYPSLWQKRIGHYFRTLSVKNRSKVSWYMRSRYFRIQPLKGFVRKNELIRSLTIKSVTMNSLAMNCLI